MRYISYRFTLKQYLLLIRLANVFTTPSNILTGYFAIIIPAYTNSVHLSALMLSSVLLYIAGIVFNDYFDIQVDQKERPYRPLPSKTVPKQNAFLIGMVSLIVANVLAFVVSWASLILSIALSAIVIAYDYWLKKTIAGPITMATARLLNVILGTSPVLFMLLENSNLFIRIVIIGILMFLYILSISILSRKEIEGTQVKQAIVYPFLIVFAVVICIMLAAYLRIFQIDLFVNLILFVSIMIITFKQSITFYSSSDVIQNAVRNMIISIIILDSVFISGTAGLYYGLPILLFIIPSMVLSRKLYMT